MFGTLTKNLNLNSLLNRLKLLLNDNITNTKVVFRNIKISLLFTNKKTPINLYRVRINKS